MIIMDEYMIEKGISDLNKEECERLAGGGWLSYVFGYLFGKIDNNVDGKDETRYGGAYLETLVGHSSIM